MVQPPVSYYVLAARQALPALSFWQPVHRWDPQVLPASAPLDTCTIVSASVVRRGDPGYAVVAMPQRAPVYFVSLRTLVGVDQHLPTGWGNKVRRPANTGRQSASVRTRMAFCGSGVAVACKRSCGCVCGPGMGSSPFRVHSDFALRSPLRASLGRCTSTSGQATALGTPCWLPNLM